MVLKNSCFLLKSFDRNHQFSVCLAFLTVIEAEKYVLKIKFNGKYRKFLLVMTMNLVHNAFECCQNSQRLIHS